MTVDLAALPLPADRRLAVRVTKDAHRQIRGGHPWVYEESITAVSHEGAAGDLAVVFDDDRRFRAIGLWDPGSPIRLKVLHAGKPRPIDDAFWQSRIGRAIEIRRPLLDDPSTDAYRIIHGENDMLPGLVVDVYADVAVVKLYTAAWVPHLRSLVPALVDALGAGSVVLRHSRNLSPADLHGLAEGDLLAGTVFGEPVRFLENGLAFGAHPTTGQKTGHFLDQRENRARVRDLAAGRTVLDVFSCTGGFSVHAAAGGARSVHSVDIAPLAIGTAERNMGLNLDVPAVAACDHRISVGDAFEVMEELAARGDSYDLVVVDPPSFASRQADIGRARRAYTRLTHLALDLIRPGGVLVQASCSSRVTADDFFDGIHEAAEAAGRRLTDIERTAHPLDHPIGFPQGAYLKALFTIVDD